MHEIELDRLADIACSQALNACVDYSQRNGSLIDAQIVKASEILREQVKAMIEPAISELQDAQNLRMGQIGMASFKATFTLVGIKAGQTAKQISTTKAVTL